MGWPRAHSFRADSLKPVVPIIHHRLHVYITVKSIYKLSSKLALEYNIVRQSPPRAQMTTSSFNLSIKGMTLTY
jgi:hypothetical protein